MKRRDLSKRVRIPLINLSSHGGVRILVELANTFARAGWDTEILIPPGRNSSVYRLEPAVEVREVGPSTGLKHLDYALFLTFLPLRLRGGLVIANFFVTYYPCLLGAFLGGGKLLYFVQDIESKYAGLAGRLLNLVCEATYRSRRMVAANDHLKAALEAKGRRVHETIHIGPTEPFFTMAKGPEERLYDLMYMPRHEAWKRMDRFDAICDELREIPRSRILCVGQDDAILDRLARKGFDTFKPKGDAELVGCFDRAKIFLLTSDREGFGLPPLEAMARGVPVVSFRCGGPDLYILDGENSFLVETTKQASGRIRSLLGDNALHSRMADAAAKSALGFRLSEGLASFVNCAHRTLLSKPAEEGMETPL